MSACWLPLQSVECRNRGYSQLFQSYYYNFQPLYNKHSPKVTKYRYEPIDKDIGKMSTQLIHSSLNTIFWSAPAALAPRIKQNKLFGVSESIKIQTDEQLMIEYY